MQLFAVINYCTVYCTPHSAQNVDILRIISTVNANHFLKQHILIGLCIGDGVFLWVGYWILAYKLDKFSFLCPTISMGLRPLACWECGFESHRVHGCLSLRNIVCR